MANNASLTWTTFGVAVCAALGTFLFGFDTGIITTTIAHASFTEYMDNPSSAITGAIVSSYIGGEAVGSIITIILGDKLGRTRYMQVLSVLVTIAVIIQTAAVNMGMFLAGRALAGIAVGYVECFPYSNSN
jgi:MFS family permease